ncbi:MAG: helix-turn-helix transcriptional regulator [Anaerolineae bacterium]|jgi:transcriptional regulator with XRE-family HTH domain
MSIEFINWIQQELNRRNWNQLDLAKRAGISAAGISKLMSGDRQPGIDIIIGLSRALNVSTDDVLRYAGLLPTATANDRQASAELCKKIEKLSESDRQIISALVNRIGG